MSVLDGQVAIVTGAGRGIGKQIALNLAAAGAAVALVARTQAQLEAVKAEIEAAGGKAIALPLDVTDRKAVEHAVEQVRQQLGTITFLVNNAGVDKPFGPIGVVDPDEWWQAQNVHVRGALLFMTACLPTMQATGKGRIVNIVSLAGILVSPNSSSYCVAKSTLIRLTEHVHAENVETGVLAFAGHPGTIATDMMNSTLNDPAAQKYVGAPLEFLRTFLESDTSHELHRLGAQLVEIAAGNMDEAAGRYIDLEQEFRPAAFGPAPEPPAHAPQ